MCMATVYSDDGVHREEVMRDVVQIEVERDGFLCFSLLGERKFLKGKLKNIDFLQEHSVVFEKEEKSHHGQL